MLRMKLVVLKEWIEENMSKGFIQQWSSLFAIPVMFSIKLDGGLRFCTDYCDIKSKTINNWYLLQLIKETLKLLGKAHIYTKLDGQGAYNSLRMNGVDKQKLAIRTRYGLSEASVMQLGTMNAPADVQGYINNSIREAFDDFASAYLDDVLIYSDSYEKQVGHVK
jgi:hypothetical protein